MTLFVGNKLMLIKPYESLENVGNIYMVADIRAGLIILKDPVSRRAVGGVPIEVIFDYFKKPEDMREWTSWSNIADMLGKRVGQFRTNGRKVQYRSWDGIKAEACCHKLDTFDVGFGLRLAYLRADAKRVMKAMDELDTQMSSYCSELLSINQEQKAMIAKLDKNLETSSVILN